MIPRRSPNSLQQPRAGQRRRWVLVIVAALGLAMSVISAVYLQLRQLDMLASEFKVDVNDRAASIQRELEQRVLRLNGLAGLFAASDEVKPDEFDRYIDDVFDPQDRAGLVAVGWAPHVTAAQRSEFETRLSQRVGRRVFIAALGERESLVPSLDKDEYYPLVHDRFLERTEIPLSLGLDQIHDAPRKRAVLESLRTDTPRMVISPHIRRLQA